MMSSSVPEQQMSNRNQMLTQHQKKLETKQIKPLAKIHSEDGDYIFHREKVNAHVYVQ